MTTDPSPIEIKKRRFSAVDCGVFALAVCSLAAPFAARLQVQAHAAGPQIAIPTEVSSVRPLDFAMGYEEKRAEAAFFQGLDQPIQTKTDAALDLALALPPEPDSPIEVPVDADIEDDETASADPIPAIPPTVILSVAVLYFSGNPDFVIEADTSDIPPPAEIEGDEDGSTGITIAPPFSTPMPSVRPKPVREDDPEIAHVQIDETAQSIDTTPLNDPVIDEAPLPPLVALNNVQPPQSIVMMTEAVNIDDLPADITPPEAAPVVVAQKTPLPARPVTKITNGPRIALVIAAAGLNANATRYAIEALPAGITLAFAPVKAEATALAREAKADGHTILVEIPMEPVNRKRDPGPLTLRGSNSPQQNLDKLNRALARIPNADGASSYLGARFNADERAAAPVLRAIADKGLFFFENEPTSRSVFQRIATGSDLRYARGIVKIDRSRGRTAIFEELDTLERQARQRGVAVGVGTALRGTISAVAEWAKEAEKRGVRLVSVTDIAR